MNKIKYSILVLVSFFFINFYGMQRTTSGVVASTTANPSVQAYFVPQDKILGPLFSILENARRQVLVAMYWITDELIVNKLIACKKSGRDVQIIIDESSEGEDYGIDLSKFVKVLVAEGIVPIIFPSKTEGIGKMHNKFVVIDGEVVLSGSANFTQAAFNPTSRVFNYENILIVYSSDIANKYSNSFAFIKQETFDIYIGRIAKNELHIIPAWMKLLLPIIYANDQSFQQHIQISLPAFNPTEKQRIERFFGLQQRATSSTSSTTSRFEPLTDRQAGLLRSRGIDTRRMSKQEASILINQISQQEGWKK